MASFGETTRGGRQIRTMRYFCSVAVNICPQELTCRADKKPIMANHVGRAPRWQCRLGNFPDGVDRPYGNETN